MKYILIPILFINSFILTQRNINWGQKIEHSTFTNLHKVDSLIYRSEQPTKDKMKSLKSLGVTNVLNLRNARNDKREARYQNINLYRIPINTWTFSLDELTECLKLIHKINQPILVHCKHGSDRTGCVIAAYRIVFQNWSKKEAIEEFTNGGYGFHYKHFKHLIRLLEELNIDKIKKEIFVE